MVTLALNSFARVVSQTLVMLLKSLAFRILRTWPFARLEIDRNVVPAGARQPYLEIKACVFAIGAFVEWRFVNRVQVRNLVVVCNASRTLVI